MNSNLHNLPRLFTEKRLAVGDSLALDESQANYLGNVMRLGTGDEVLLFNGRDGEWGAQLGKIGKKKGTSTWSDPSRRSSCRRRIRCGAAQAPRAERCPVHKTLAHGVTFEDNATFGLRSET